MTAQKIDVKKLLYEILEDDLVFDENIDLVECGLLDSLAFAELFTALEDYGIEIHPTRIDRTKLRTVKGIEELVKSHM